VSSNNCISICSNGIAAVIGHIKEFLSFAQKENLSFVTAQCFLHRDAQMVKRTEGNGLGNVIKTIINKSNIKMVH
jgi:hypothetical protein